MYNRNAIKTLGVLSITYGIFLILYVLWKLLAKPSTFAGSDPIFIIPQCIYGILFLIGGIGVLFSNNKFRILLVIIALSKILFLLVFINLTFKSLFAHITKFAPAYPLYFAHDVFSTLFSIILVVILSKRSVVEIFINRSIEVNEYIRSKVKWYIAFSFILFVPFILNVIETGMSYHLLNTIGFWILLLLIWRIIANLLAIKKL